VEDLARGWFAALDALVRHAAQPGAGGRTPSDLPLITLSQAEIERLEHDHPALEDILPLAPLQEGLLFHALYAAQGPDVYITQLVLGLEGALDGATLRTAADALLARHASLRVAFRHAELSRPVQIVMAAVRAPWRSVDLSGFDAATQDARLKAVMAEDYATHFDLGTAPLLRFTLIHLAPQQHRLLFAHHHILMDGWSAPVLMRELMTLYGEHGGVTSLPAVTPYRDYLSWVAAQDRAAASDAWSAALTGLETPCLVAPADRARAPVLPEQITLALSDTASAALTQAARARGLTLNTYMQAAWALLLGRLTGRDDVVFGVTVAGRPAEIAGIESMVGLFINTLPLRLRLPAEQPLGVLLDRLQQEQAALMAHQHLGLTAIQGLAGLGELFDTLMVFENYPVDRAGLEASSGRLRLSEVGGRDATHYPLSLAAALSGERLHLRLDYRGELFTRDQARAMADRLVRLLEAAAAAPDLAVGRLDALSAEERRTLLRDWNATARPFPATTLPELFAAQAARTPDAVAVVFGDETLRYGDLDRRANRLAHHLRALGVGPEVVVGLCVPRSLDLVVALLGILKAGGVYLPLDPDYPAERRD